MMEEFNFEKLDVYKKSLIFADLAHETAKLFPSEEKYVLADQFRRASLSITLNIAEGHGQSPMQFKRYLNISKGSVRECVAIVELANIRKYISPSEREKLRTSCVELSKMIAGLINSVK